MTYELAKQLKDAGFPQESLGDVFPSTYYENDGADIKYRHIEDSKGVKIPTLSELIVALGDKFGVLERFPHSGKFGAYVPNDIGISATGDSPEEVLAELWLKTHEL